MAKKKNAVEVTENVEPTAALVKRSKFAEESAAAAPVPSNTMLSLFASAGGDEDSELAKVLGKLERRNLPPMIQPKSIPVGMAVQGTIVKIVPSPVSTIKGRLLWLVYKGTDFMLPCTGAIRSALAPGLKDDNDKLDKELEKQVGLFLWAKRLPDKESKYGKPMFVFDVRTGKV